MQTARSHTALTNCANGAVYKAVQAKNNHNNPLNPLSTNSFPPERTKQVPADPESGARVLLSERHSKLRS